MSIDATDVLDKKFADAYTQLERKKLRLTLSRVATLAVLLDARQALSVDAVYNILVESGRPLSRASVYRALGEFERVGLAVQGWENIESGRMVYARAPATAPADDVRLVCSACGRAAHVQDKLLSQQLYYHALRCGFEQRLASLELQTVCNDCAT